MYISELLIQDRIACNGSVQSKKRALEHLSDLLATDNPNLTSEEIFLSLINRERLGSTSLGHGVALPHGRIHGREHAIGAFIKLNSGIDFDAIDNQPVDLLYALLVPEHYTYEHLKIISELAEAFKDADFRDALRKCDTNEQLHEVMMATFTDKTVYADN